MSNYGDWLVRREAVSPTQGITGASISDRLFPHQRTITEWALARGRAAVFADTGLGKTFIQLEWARVVAERFGPVLILAPLAVAEQTCAEGERFGIRAAYAREPVAEPITVANYEMLHAFNPGDYAGIVLDESSILKNYTGATRNEIITSFRDTPYRLACTATPAPNDHIELGNHSEFLGIKTRVEMLSEYFVHDGGSTQHWRIKGHAIDVFWRWVATWGRVVKQPSDLGFSDDGFALPELRMLEHIVAANHADARKAGLLFAPDVHTLSDQRATRRFTMDARVERAAQLVGGDHPAVVWCELNDESDAVTDAIPGAVQVRGADDHEVKRAALVAFSRGEIRVLVTKPSIAGFGMNWQHCANMVFLGASHSYEQTYQAIRRCWRFGQTRPVTVHVIRADTESAIVANYKRKEQEAAAMATAMIEHMRAVQIVAATREWNPYEPRTRMRVPSWVQEGP